MPNIHTILREARESKGLSIKDAAKALKLRERHIQMAEEGRFADLSKEIYLKGFLKTYTKWLNVDGVNFITEANQQKRKILKKEDNAAFAIATGIAYVHDIISFFLRPGISAFAISIFLTVFIYLFWSQNHKTTENVDIISSLEASQASLSSQKQYSNILPEYRGKNLILFAGSSLELKITDTNTGQEKINRMEPGDAFFIKAEDSTVLTSSQSADIEVYIDDGKEQKDIGAMDRILMNF